MSKIHARFWVQSVNKQTVSGGEIIRSVVLAPVVRATPLEGSDGNVDWSKYTPSGRIELTITKDGAGQEFEDALGKDVAITFEVIE